jgi:hypothetical protein
LVGAWALGAATRVWAGDASDRPTFVTAGALFDGTWLRRDGEGLLPALGAEVSLHRHAFGPSDPPRGQNALPIPDWWLGGGYGAFAQLEWVDPRAMRGAIGGQVSFSALGAELACVAQTATRGFAGTLSMRPAIYVSFGYVHVAFRVDLPLLARADGARPGVTPSFAIGLKWPLRI